ncbi:MAG: hypothetical protein COV29_01950 [Candidatus Yanofskybacteria bacterium CG10_big_fil_rev_8_21_14_0_10_36_16]|uniref:UDP-N-acetylmuramoyl-tripeptide--D-alanyl-D-alanine ligase n=1 Tax=Candidatus Yanofskybacteria bacterium CG10_big_fil_rev_8_21_14_0_10_36_16 TaxID=1975096 RepID=A0A2J0Q7G7_9BACT|nr:MAG: hypothetical protein COV29_01950 [Candidatus Yanofskybacteria bacterium CG10_big_fil_rev_8_21_14_0_10_36_16]
MSVSFNFLKFILRKAAKRTIQRYKPTVVGITGSAGKTMAKEAIYTVLSHKFKVRKNAENFNNEIGVPLTILGVDPRLSTANIKPNNWPRLLKFWWNLFPAFWRAYGPFDPNYPEILVLEMAAAKPGDIDYLVDIARPKVGVVTTVGDIPVHVEYYPSPSAVAKEKARLVEALVDQNSLAVLNFDDKVVLDMQNKIKAPVLTMGLSSKADIWASGISYFVSDDGENVGGISFKVNKESTFVPFKVSGVVGIHQIYSLLSAVAVGLHFGINIIDASVALEKMELPGGRMRLIEGIKNSKIIDDTYNASPLAVHAALETLKSLADATERFTQERIRRIAVLGDMKELGKYTEQAHRSIGNIACEIADIVITVGDAAKFIADSAMSQKMKDNIYSFSTSREAKDKVKKIIEAGDGNDLVLIKGSHSMKMDEIVDEIKI